MRSRLLVGQGRLASDLLAALDERPESLAVMSDDREHLEALRERDLGATVHNDDPTDPAAIRDIEEVDSVLAVDDDGRFNAAVLAAVAETIPSAFTLGYTGSGGDTSSAVHDYADRVIDPGEAVVGAVQSRLGPAATRTRKLKRVVADIDGPLAVFTHDNPDPDAIASAVAFGRIVESLGKECRACYYGSISHQENRAFVNLLDIELQNVDADRDLSSFGGIALVDHSRPGENDQLPPETPIDIVIDHHPPNGPVEATFVDLRSDVGATSTLMVEYFHQFGLDIDETVATALLFGIRVDTDEFVREVSVADFEAAATLIERADLGALQRIESPSVDADTMETIADAITNRTEHGPALISGVGSIGNRDALAQAADRLLNLEDVTTTLVHGIVDGTVYVSARARGADVDLGEVLRDAFGQIGSAGGHADMAGAQIELGVIEAEREDKPLPEVVDRIVSDRFLDVLEARWNRTSRHVGKETYFVAGDATVDTDDGPLGEDSG